MRLRRRDPGGPPDFVGVGAEGAGAAWWLAALTAHPQIAGPHESAGSLRFFDAFCTREMTGEDVSVYHAHFPAADEVLRGEWTEHYAADGWTPPLLRRAAPGARLLLMVSDPVERFRSVFAERQAVREEGKRLVITDVVDRASHAFQLARLRRYFPAERILVLQHERCCAEPHGEYRRTLEFLGMGEHDPGAALTPDPRPAPAAPAWPELEAALLAALEPEIDALRALVPELDVALWPSFAHLAATPRA